jgi:hypothetical protein
MRGVKYFIYGLARLGLTIPNKHYQTLQNKILLSFIAKKNAMCCINLFYVYLAGCFNADGCLTFIFLKLSGSLVVVWYEQFALDIQ